ncbi:N-acetyltransferase eco [Eurosta solidaginis]|uniref:N-acetyltransferase eco n=1 Tax=Eurosta solidaginis TaxID=178769 RepID=UPI003531106E
MDTPKSARKLRPTRNPTPRLSARKKSLFLDAHKEAGNDILDGIEFIEPLCDSSENVSVMKSGGRDIERLLEARSSKNVIRFFGDAPDVDAALLRRSPRTKPKAKNSQHMIKSTNGKENTLKAIDAEEVADEQLTNFFNTSMRISSHSQHSNSIDPKHLKETQKRHHQDVNEIADWSPLRKNRKCTSNDDEPSTISTKKFYSTSQTKSYSNIQHTSENSKFASSPRSNKAHISPRSRVRLSRRIPGKLSINKGVRHKIRRPARSNVPGRGHIGTTPFSSIDIDFILKNVHNEKLRNLIASKREERLNIEKIHNIFRRCPNPIEMARPLTVLSVIEDTNNNLCEKNDVNKTKSDIAEDDDRDFSDIDSLSDQYEEVSNADEIIPLISHQPAVIEAAITQSEYDTRHDDTSPAKRKFFKTGRSYHTPKEVRITDNIKASICKGKLSLIQEDKRVKKKAKRRTSTTYDITDEQATVETILKNLDDTTYGDIAISDNFEEKREENKGSHLIEPTLNNLSSDLDYSSFRNRLPHNTTDPSVIEQQHILLDFLINNNMCTEDNFTIFIADPDNHKEEAARIVDQVFVLVNEQDYFRQRIPCNTTDPKVEAQQHRMLDFLITNNICTDENFDIFIANHSQRCKEADEIITAIRNNNKNISMPSGLHDVINDASRNHCENNNKLNTSNSLENGQLVDKTTESTQINSHIILTPLPLHGAEQDSKDKLFPIFYTNRWKPLQQQSKRNIPRTWIMGRGSNQYQIDAGQKNFGARQCKQCGLVYSVHEPEEEVLHRDFHASLNLLRFKGWIDEDIVAIYQEWGADGRILRITEASHARRHERLSDIFTIVDKELGFSSSYVIPQTFVAYLAVRKYQIVGLCLVVPLEKANKYITVDGVDCCTEEEFPAKCGISRIWVAPLHRRLHIASKLIHAVQQNTIFGEEIPVNKIAFSAPTENGIKFAQKVTQLEDFLVYQ